MVMWFPWWPMSLFPLLFIFFIARAASRFFRTTRRRELDVDRYVEEPLRSIGTPRTQNSYEARIFKLAYRLKGRITVSDVVVETGLDVAEAESVMQSMIDNTHVRLEVDDNGILTYEFPEIIRRFESE